MFFFYLLLFPLFVLLIVIFVNPILFFLSLLSAHTQHIRSTLTTYMCKIWALWLTLMDGSHKSQELCTGKAEMEFLLCSDSPLSRWYHCSRELHKFFMGPSTKHKQYLTEVCHGHAPSTLNILFLSSLSMFRKLEWLRYIRGGMGTSYSTSSQLSDVMYLMFTLPDSCHDTLCYWL